VRVLEDITRAAKSPRPCLSLEGSSPTIVATGHPAMTLRILATIATAAVLSAAAQATPATNFTDLWWNPNESGWGVSFAQHAGSTQVFAVWYTYHPRVTGTAGANKPLWIVMPGGQWSSPNSISGTVYVANGMPFNQSGSNLQMS